jgi:hypothetical protein
LSKTASNSDITTNPPQPKPLPDYLKGSKGANLFLSVNQAIAGGVYELSHDGKRLGVFKSVEELDKPRVMYSIATLSNGDSDPDFAWLEKDADRVLALSASSKGGMGLKMLVDVLKAVMGSNQEEPGLTDLIRNFISSRSQ